MGELLEQARAVLPDAVEVRRALHRIPEVGLTLPQTREHVLGVLEALPIDALWQSQVNSGLIATLRGARPGKTLMLRADMDALPMPEHSGEPFSSENEGAMHACGHDAHMAMLLGAARLLADRRDELSGTVKLLFQPGEEGYHGARELIEEGILNDAPAVDAAFGIHVAPLTPVGTLFTRKGAFMAAADNFSIELVGRGGHASMPDRALDPIPAACELVQALQSMVTRRIDAHDPGVLTVGKLHAGTTSNVIPERATLEGTMRSFSARTRRALREGLERVSQGVAQAHELEARVKIVPGYPVVDNHPDFTDFTLSVARELLGDEQVVEARSPMMGAEDFSYYLQHVPGTFVFLGMRPEGPGEAHNIHSSRMRLAEDGMASGIALHAAIALRYLDGSDHG